MCKHAIALRATQDDLASYRGFRALVADWINNQHAIDHHTRADLAQHIGLPAPRDLAEGTTPRV